MLEEVTVECPYCGELFGTTVDLSGGSAEYVEDCQICCQPILFRIRVTGDVLEQLTIEREQE